MLCWSQALGSVGSVSGGCIEEDILECIKSCQLNINTPTQIEYGGDQAQRFKLPCGGKLSVLVEPLQYSETELHKWKQCQQSLAVRKGMTRHVNLQTGQWHTEHAPYHPFSCDSQDMCQYLGAYRQLLIVGANDVARYLADFAVALEYVVTVCDPSPELGPYWRNARHFRFLHQYPDGFIERDFHDKHSAVVAVSHDPRIDDMALLEALNTQAFYIGAMGSQKTSQKRLERLASLGIESSALSLLRAPIGLDIGSKTPAEIAMSIAADLVRAQS